VHHANSIIITHFACLETRCLQTSCKEDAKLLPPCWTRQIQVRPNHPWARCSAFIPPPPTGAKKLSIYINQVLVHCTEDIPVGKVGQASTPQSCFVVDDSKGLSPELVVQRCSALLLSHVSAINPVQRCHVMAAAGVLQCVTCTTCRNLQSATCTRPRQKF
jgi:hypothetical protein